MIGKIIFAMAVRLELLKKSKFAFCTGLSGRVCHRPEQKSFTSSGRYISLFFTSNTNMLSGRGMTLLFTAFNDGKLLAKSSPHPQTPHYDIYIHDSYSKGQTDPLFQFCSVVI